MKPSFFSGCHPEKILVEIYPIFFMTEKAPIFSKQKIGCRLKGRGTSQLAFGSKIFFAFVINFF